MGAATTVPLLPATVETRGGRGGVTVQPRAAPGLPELRSQRAAGVGCAPARAVRRLRVHLRGEARQPTARDDGMGRAGQEPARTSQLRDDKDCVQVSSIEVVLNGTDSVEVLCMAVQKN